MAVFPCLRPRLSEPTPHPQALTAPKPVTTIVGCCSTFFSKRTPSLVTGDACGHRGLDAGGSILEQRFPGDVRKGTCVPCSGQTRGSLYGDRETRSHPRRVRDARAEHVVVSSAGRAATIGEVDALAHTLAATLHGAGLGEDTLVGLAAANGPAFLAGFLAVRSAGHGIILLDASAPETDRRRTAAALGASALLSCCTGWPRDVDDWAFVPIPVVDDSEPLRIGGSPIVKVTSGSTGLPRGVVATAENVCADQEALYATMGLRDAERILASIPMAHSYGLSAVALPALLRGSPVVVPEAGSPLAPLEAARTGEVTFFPTVPAYLQGLLSLARPEAWPPSVCLVISAGALLPPATAAGFREVYGRPVHCFYGASECGGICYDREGSAAERGTVGTPVDGVAIELQPLPGAAGDQGAVTVTSAAVARRYLQDPDLRLAGGHFHASDRATWEGSELRLLGRIDGLINVKGKKVDPGEVERVLADLDGVLEVVVLGIPSRLDGNEVVRAVVACQPDALAADDVLAFCRDRLAEHKRPRSVRLVAEIPRTSSGKVDRQALLTLEGPISRP
jgi:long-chain acyl-CoA synthetase